MILIKGRRVQLEMADGRWIVPPARHGIIHDPDGVQLPKCSVFVGPYTTTRTPAPMTRDAEAYFGSDYQAVSAVVDVPKGPWALVGEAVQIRYDRPGTKYRGKYFHFFEKRTTVQIFRCRRHLRVELQHGCIVNWRGFVYP